MGDAESALWPDGKSFAFTVFDDTDRATLENTRPVYEMLAELGFRTTKSVWAVDPEVTPRIGGVTCDDPVYRDWTLSLQAAGFEIGSHGASSATSRRALAARSLDRFREIYGHDPVTLANHADCEESIYWGEHRVGGAARVVYNIMTGFRRRGVFRGHREGDPLFWGDLCRERVRYVRNFTFMDIDTLAACPLMPYHDPQRPFVRSWFASSEGANVDAYNACVAEAAQDRLEASGGACIMYTHFASGFYRDGRINPRFRALMERLAAKNGWFVPTGVLLDHLASRRGIVSLTSRQRSSLERRWLASKMRIGHS
jgi:hypothetical protein